MSVTSVCPVVNSLTTPVQWFGRWSCRRQRFLQSEENNGGWLKKKKVTVTYDNEVTQKWERVLTTQTKFENMFLVCIWENTFPTVYVCVSAFFPLLSLCLCGWMGAHTLVYMCLHVCFCSLMWVHTQLFVCVCVYINSVISTLLCWRTSKVTKTYDYI